MPVGGPGSGISSFNKEEKELLSTLLRKISKRLQGIEHALKQFEKERLEKRHREGVPLSR